MIEKTIQIMSEDLARVMDRRKFLKRAGQAAFLGLAALAAGHALPTRAGADGKPPPNIHCNPPGPYCNLNGVNEPNGCHGASCFQHLYAGQVWQCRLFYQFFPYGCFTVQESNGHWTCCDCECGNPRVAMCGCAQWSETPTPRPDGPDGRSA